VDDVFALRDGCVEDGTVFWTAAQGLDAGAQLHELGLGVSQ